MNDIVTRFYYFNGQCFVHRLADILDSMFTLACHCGSRILAARWAVRRHDNLRGLSREFPSSICLIQLAGVLGNEARFLTVLSQRLAPT